jgi:hypothetical protein
MPVNTLAKQFPGSRTILRRADTVFPAIAG